MPRAQALDLITQSADQTGANKETAALTRLVANAVYDCESCTEGQVVGAFVDSCLRGHRPDADSGTRSKPSARRVPSAHSGASPSHHPDSP